MKPIRTTCLAITWSACSIASAQCPTGDVVIGSPADLAAFATAFGNCDTLPGGLSISFTDIIDYSAFSNVRMIGGDLFISAIPPGPPDLAGFDQLEHIGGDLWLNSLPPISLNGLGNLQRIDGDLKIEFVGITNFTGLSSLSVLGGDLTLLGTSEFTSFLGLNQLDTIHGSVIAEGLENTSFTTITVPPDLKYVGGQLRIMANNATSMTGGNALDRVNGGLYISGPMLQSVSGMNNLNHVGELVFQHLPVFTSINAFNGLDTVEGYFQVYDTPLLPTLSGFPELDRIGGSMWIAGNSLTSITGFPQLDSIGDLHLAGNPVLQNITAFDHAIEMGDLTIVDNPMLSYCHVQAICDHLLDPPYFPSISNNAAGCGSEVEIMSFCDLTTGVDDRLFDRMVIYPNPVNDVLQIGSLELGSAYSIADAQGRIIHSDRIRHSSIDVSEMAPGYYKLLIENGGRFDRFSFVKE